MFGYYPPYIILIYVGLALLIPASVLIGGFIPGGPRAITSGATLVAMAAFWTLAQGVYLDRLILTQRFTGMVVAGFAGNVLALATWTLVLADATRTRRWGWYVVAVLAGLAVFAATISFLLTPSVQACAYAITSAYCTTGGMTY